MSVPLTNTERTAIEKDEILINTQTADGFWYSPVFNLPFADLSTKEQLSIEAEFYKTFGEVGFSMYIYKSKIDNRTVNYKLIFSHEIAKKIRQFQEIIKQSVKNIIATNYPYGVSKGFKENINRIVGLLEGDGKIVSFEKVMFFSADNFNGDSRTYSKVLAEIDSKMKGLAGLGAKKKAELPLELRIIAAKKAELQKDFDKVNNEHQTFKEDSLRFIAMVEKSIFENSNISKAKFEEYLELWKNGTNFITFYSFFEPFFIPNQDLAERFGFDYEKVGSEHRFFRGNHSFRVDTKTELITVYTPKGKFQHEIDSIPEHKKYLNSDAYSIGNLQYWNKSKSYTKPKGKQAKEHFPPLENLQFNLQQATENALPELAAYFQDLIDKRQYTTEEDIAAEKAKKEEQEKEKNAERKSFEQKLEIAKKYPISSDIYKAGIEAYNESRKIKNSDYVKYYFEKEIIEVYEEVKNLVPYDFFKISYDAYKEFYLYQFLRDWREKGTAKMLVDTQKNYQHLIHIHSKYFKKDGGVKSQYKYTASAENILDRYYAQMRKYHSLFALLETHNKPIETNFALQQVKKLLNLYKNDSQGLAGRVEDFENNYPLSKDKQKIVKNFVVYYSYMFVGKGAGENDNQKRIKNEIANIWENKYDFTEEEIKLGFDFLFKTYLNTSAKYGFFINSMTNIGKNEKDYDKIIAELKQNWAIVDNARLDKYRAESKSMAYFIDLVPRNNKEKKYWAVVELLLNSVDDYYKEKDLFSETSIKRNGIVQQYREYDKANGKTLREGITIKNISYTNYYIFNVYAIIGGAYEVGGTMTGGIQVGKTFVCKWLDKQQIKDFLIMQHEIELLPPTPIMLGDGYLLLESEATMKAAGRTIRKNVSSPRLSRTMQNVLPLDINASEFWKKYPNHTYRGVDSKFLNQSNLYNSSKSLADLEYSVDIVDNEYETAMQQAKKLKKLYANDNGGIL